MMPWYNQVLKYESTVIPIIMIQGYPCCCDMQVTYGITAWGLCHPDPGLPSSNYLSGSSTTQGLKPEPC